MAVRYVEIGQYPDVRREVRGNLSEILAATANPGTYAAPEDVTGTFLEMGADGKWDGASVGALTQAQADALYASGAMATVKVGTPGNVSGVLYSWSGSAWVASGAVVTLDDACSVVSAASATPINFPVATIKGGSIGDRQDFSISWLVTTSGAGGSFEMQLGGVALNGSFGYASGDVLYFTATLTVIGSQIRRIRWIANSLNVTTALLNVDMSADTVLNIKITPAIGNSTTVTQLKVRVQQ